jgi:tRNA modification GTPase
MRRTLACRLTPLGEGGISLIELSGPHSADILDRLFASPRRRRIAEMTPGRLLYGKLFRCGALLDEVVIECAKTGEQGVFVVNCHGGALAARRVIEAFAAEGARPAGNKEFLARQRRIGLLDRIQEEAAERIPRAPTFRAVQVLLDQYDGALSRALDALRPRSGSRPGWSRIAARLRQFLSTATFGRGIARPPRLVVAGRPNVGKSTLANALLRDDRIIVHPAPGTTRDTIEELLSIRGLPFTLVDTAGLRAAHDEIEREGVRRGAQALRRADIALLVFDASMPLQEEDRRILAVELARKQKRAGRGARRLPVLNKSDLPAAIPPELILEKTGRRPVLVSAATGAGLRELEERILEAAYPKMPPRGAPVLFTVRQERLIQSALVAAQKKDRGQLLARLDEAVGI